ncbi:major facilitator superfamily domain-containing protein [Penicillium capsulatum]|uniref:Major facilitator superfamily domain-containing protein n=1 Tax=Penicillium capsulatum TaxID=69766 RepID=A0A9W9HME5_9EURO|nr:major facilitator superfamily domain-containing protein [Penicillium capsulatum]KAJ6112916.1 major facilitator superfamily domain-containing protein [Penicillium capsulatum]
MIEESRLDPSSWPKKRKLFTFVTGLTIVLNSTLGSALPSGAIDSIAADFNITNEQQLVLPITTYLIGYILGPIIFAPLSETYGRRPVMLWTFAGYTIFTLACAVAPNFAAIVIFRLFSGIFGSSPTAVVGGIYADIFSDPKARGRSMAGYMAATTLGPTVGPVISGYISTISWRWTFWIALIIAGTSWPALIFLPETFRPLLMRKYNKVHPLASADTISAPPSLRDLVTRVLTRPIRMIYSESIVLFSCTYLSLAYSIFYLFFEAYPIIFQGIYGFSTGQCGLAFIPIGIGALLSFMVYLTYDSVYQRAISQNKPWIKVEEYRRLPLACIGGPLYTIALFWLAWSAQPSIHWIVPLLSGIPFGIGFLLIFMALINYLADAYGIYAASALGAASCTRSVSGALLPLATAPMFARLGVHWATSVLGFASLAMIVIPFAFIQFGGYLRRNSSFSQSANAR